MDISEYIEIEKKYRVLEKDLEGYREELEQKEEELKELKQERENQLENVTKDKESYIQSELEKEKSNKTDDLIKQLDAMKREIERIENESIDKEDSKYSDEFYTFKELTNSVDEYMLENKDYCKRYLPLIKSKELSIPKDLSIFDYYSLTNEYFETVLNRKDIDLRINTFDKISRLIFKGSMLSTKFKSEIKVVYIVAYYSYIVLILFLFPQITISYILITLFIFYKKSKPNKYEFLENIMSLKKCKVTNNILKKKIKEYTNENLQNAEKELEKDKKNRIKETNKLVLRKEREIQDKIEVINKEYIEYSKTDDYEQKQKEEIGKRFDKFIDELEEDTEDYRKNVQECEAEFNECKEKMENGKKELEERYFMLNSAGTDKILPKQFLLGFNNYIPITLDMKDYTLHLLTNINDEDIVKRFFNMCIMQILCTINPSCVEINIIDLENGTKDYGIFGNIPEIFKIYTTKEEVMSLMKQLYKEKTERDCFIKPLANDINEYNRGMIENYGKTIPYKILIVTNNIDELIGNSEFLKIQRSGDVGIVTIATWDKNIFTVKTEHNKDKKYYDKLILHLNSIGNVNYLGALGELSPVDESYITTKVRDLKMQRRRINV